MLARDIEIRGTTWPWIPWVSFLLTNPRLGARESSNTETSMDKGKKKCHKSHIFLAKGPEKGSLV